MLEETRIPRALTVHSPSTSPLALPTGLGSYCLPQVTDTPPSPSWGQDMDSESCEYEYFSVLHSRLLFIHSINIH